MSEIVVGIDDSAGAQDALAFAQRLAGRTGARLRLVSAYPYREWPSRAAGHELGAYLRSESEALLDRLGASLGDEGVAKDAIADPSPARALHRLADETVAALIVVGSTESGAVGRVLPGSTAERLLHGSPCPVAIVPHGYAKQADAPIETIGAGYDASGESKAALAAACHAARRFGADLRVIGVFDATQVGTPALMAGPAYVTAHADDEALQRASLERAVAGLADDVSAQAVFVAGNPGRELAAQSESLDLMVVGSRGYGPLAAVLLGGVSHTLTRSAACPVIVLPRGARDHTSALFAPAAEAGAP